MSKPLHEIVDAVHAARRQAEAIIALGEYVKDVASVEQATSEAHARLAAKQEQEAAQNERLAKLADAIAMAEADIAASKVKANQIVTDAVREGGRQRQEAIAKADKIVADAKAEAERIKGPLNAELGKLRVDVSDFAQRRLDLDDSIKAAQDELDAINARIASARKAISDLLKG